MPSRSRHSAPPSLFALALAAGGCPSEDHGVDDVADASDVGDTFAPADDDVAEDDDAVTSSDVVDVGAASDGYGCWVEGSWTRIEDGVCGYSSATAALGSRTTSAYFSTSIHPFTCYMQTRDAEDEYDGGCDEADETGAGTQFRMNWECDDGGRHSSGWLDAHEFDGGCVDGGFISGCEIQSRAPGCGAPSP